MKWSPRAAIFSVCHVLVGHPDLAILKRPPAAVDDVVDRAVVFERVATGDVVVVRVAIAPHEPESLIDAACQRAGSDAESHVVQRIVPHYGQGESIVGLVGARLQQNVILTASLALDGPLPLGALAGARKLEVSGQRAEIIAFEREHSWLCRVGGETSKATNEMRSAASRGRMEFLLRSVESFYCLC